MLEFKTLLNPTRLAIMAIVCQHFRIPLAKIRKLLGISWGNLDTHIRRLTKEKYVIVRRDFIDGSPRLTIILEPQGSSDYRKFKKIWDDLHQ